MKNTNVSIKDVFNKSMSNIKSNWKKAFISSLIQFGVFLILFLLTNSVTLSLISWLLFLPTQTIFLTNMADENVKFEQVFKLGKNGLTYLLLAILSVICYVVGFALAIVPAILLFVNYAFVFEFAKDNDLMTSLKKASQTAKGYRPKLLAISLIYLFILLVLVAFSILVAILVGLCLQTNHYMLYVWGVFGGLCLFLMFVMPVMVVTIHELKKAIEKDKEVTEQNKNKQSENNMVEQDDKEKVENVENENISDAQENINAEVVEQQENLPTQDDEDDKDQTDSDPTDLIV